jgi:hypothetical protein
MSNSTREQEFVLIMDKIRARLGKDYIWRYIQVYRYACNGVRVARVWSSWSPDLDQSVRPEPDISIRLPFNKSGR